MDNTDTQSTGAVAPSEATAGVSEDTATIQNSAASESSQVAPEAAQTQEGSSEVKAEDTAQEEKLYAGKYKTVEDLEKSYKELESSYGRSKSEYADLTKILNEAFASPESTSATEASQNQDTEYGYQDDDTAKQTQANPLERKVTVLEFSMTHQDADAEAMKEILMSDPLVNRINGDDAKLEYAYLRAKEKTSGKAIKEAERRAQEQAAVKVAEKEVAKVESASKSEPIDEDGELRTQAMTGSPSERKAARAALIRKHLVEL